MDGDDVVATVVKCRKTSKFQRLPAVDRKQPRSAEANQLVLASRTAVIEEVATQRFAERTSVRAALLAVGATISQENAFGNWISATISRRGIEELLRHPDVEYLSAYYEQTPFPVLFGRVALNSDQWYNAGNDGDVAFLYAALIDSGVRSSHVQFTAGGGGFLGLHRDCAQGDGSCLNLPFNPAYNDQDPVYNHGTGAANIIMGGVGLSNTFRGTSRVELDYYNVGANNGAGPVDGVVPNAISRAISGGAHLLVVNVQAPQAANGAISDAADDAFDLGAVVVAANGNISQVPAVSAPANAQKTLGVGDYDAVSNSWVAARFGDVDAQRSKPDLRAPTNVLTASNAVSNTGTRNFDGTSGAAAFAGALAAIVWDWHDQVGFSTEPGAIYASMLVLGDATQPTYESGSGNVRLPACALWWSGKVSMTGSMTDVDIFPAIPSGYRDLKASIWWPENFTDAHNDIDIVVRNPSNVFVSHSITAGQIREHIFINSNLTPGTWKVTIHSHSQPRTPQAVYYTIMAQCQ